MIRYIPINGFHRADNYSVNTLRPRQNGRHFPDDIFKLIFLNENILISINISLTFIPRGPINNIPTLVQVMAWRRPGDKPLSEPMMVNLLTHICVTRPQWVKLYYKFHVCIAFLASKRVCRWPCVNGDTLLTFWWRTAPFCLNSDLGYWFKKQHFVRLVVSKIGRYCLKIMTCCIFGSNPLLTRTIFLIYTICVPTYTWIERCGNKWKYLLHRWL